MEKWYQQTDVMLGLAVVMVVAMLVVPIPTFLLDLLIGISIMLGLITLLTAMYNTNGSNFSIFPSLLLITTVYRLALNVSSTRLILLEGPSFDGKLIRSFGDFVVGGNYIIGFIIFLILIFVQMLVITKGATRISEVAARFTLDALPGKQMSIDSDLSSGIIAEEEARSKRTELRKEVDFYGQMDGATKFVQGDVRVGLIITAVNIIGGLSIGVFMHNQTFSDALSTYTLLTVGDGLTAQLPSLLITTATGMVVTRANANTHIADDLSEQLFKNPRILWIVAATLAASSVIPGFPKVPLWSVAFLLGFLAYSINKSQGKEATKAEEESHKKAPLMQERFLDEISIDPLKLEIGYNLIPLVDVNQKGILLEKITLLRQKFARDMGMIVPPIRINDNMNLESNEYCILVGGIEVARAKVYPDKLAALDKGNISEPMQGDAYKDPTFNVPAVLIPPTQKEEAQKRGYLIVDANNILITHISEILRRYSTQIMGREEIKMLLDKTKEKYPVVVEEVTKGMTSGAIQQVLHNLLKESVSIRNLVTILEALADNCERIKDPNLLTEIVRQRIGMQIVNQHLENNVLNVISIDPLIENEMRSSVYVDEKEGRIFSLDPKVQSMIRDALLESYRQAQTRSQLPIYLSSSEIRMGIFMILEREVSPHSFMVLGYEELPANIKVEPMGQVILKQQEEVNT